MWQEISPIRSIRRRISARVSGDYCGDKSKCRREEPDTCLVQFLKDVPGDDACHRPVNWSAGGRLRWDLRSRLSSGIGTRFLRYRWTESPCLLSMAPARLTVREFCGD